jgi:hypothetical protein
MNESAHWDPFREDLTEPFPSLHIAGLYKKYMSSLLQGNWLKAGDEINWEGKYTPTGEKMAEAFWRTLLVNHDIYARDDLNRRMPLTTDVTSIFELFAHCKALSRGLWPNSRGGKGIRLRPRRIERLQSSLMYKRFFVAESGLLGVAPSNVRLGDLVCVMLGGKVLFGLREMGGEHYQLVEEAYLHGYMDGRAIDLAHEGKLRELDSRIW